jgi:urea transport system substrate-binding protein
MKKILLVAALIAGLLALAAFGWNRWRAHLYSAHPILVGILHSQTGAMAISEKSMIDAELLAIHEINARGGLLGREIKPIIRDGKSDWPTYARQARALIDDDHVSVIFGCWTSASRKNVLPVVEEKNHLLIYPMAYEGLEQSPNIIYTGAAPNQQIIPAVKWSYDYRNARRFFLVGSDYVWPHSVNAIIKDQLNALGAELVGEEYIFFGSSNVRGVVREIVKAKPDVVLSAVVGDTNLPFYKELRAAGIRPEKTPVISFSIAEDELRNMPPDEVAGHYAAWNYFQSIDRPENHEFVKRFKMMYPKDPETGKERVTSDVMTAAYNSVWLWAHAVEDGNTEDVETVRRTIGRQSLDAPEGVVSVDPETRHTWRPVYLARMRRDGQFDVEWTSEKPIRPVPYPITRSRSEWEAFLDGLYKGWGEKWANPVDNTRKAPTD